VSHEPWSAVLRETFWLVICVGLFLAITAVAR
jgi:hypothetical protein